MCGKEQIMAVHTAIKAGDTETLIGLLQSDDRLRQLWTPFGTWLHDAASYGALPIVRWLVNHGLELNAWNESNESTPIALAASDGHSDVVRFLIDSGASLDTSDSVRNPLLAAIVGGDSDAHTLVAKLLIDGGIDTTIRYPNLDNMDALEMAREYGRSGIVKLLERV